MKFKKDDIKEIEHAMIDFDYAYERLIETFIAANIEFETFDETYAIDRSFRTIKRKVNKLIEYLE